MKVRIRGNSVRFRLSQADVKILGTARAVEDQVSFSPTAFLRFRLAVATVGQVVAALDGTTMTVTIPAAAAAGWMGSEEVGLYAEQAIAGGSNLRIAIEKDFACIDGPVEENADAFPNPKASCT